jgi:cell wall assembly regulator SMI1
MARSKRPTKSQRTGAAGASGSNHLAELLARTDKWLKKHRPNYYQALAPGMSADEAQAMEKALGKPLPKELRTWLSWHNGQGDEIVGSFVESFNLMSASQIIDAKKELDGGPPAGWKKSWLPFLDDDAGDYVCMCPDKGSAPVREVWQGQDECPVVAASLTAWVEDFVTALEAGKFVEDEERGGFHRQER